MEHLLAEIISQAFRELVDDQMVNLVEQLDIPPFHYESLFTHRHPHIDPGESVEPRVLQHRCPHQLEIKFKEQSGRHLPDLHMSEILTYTHPWPEPELEIVLAHPGSRFGIRFDPALRPEDVSVVAEDLSVEVDHVPVHGHHAAGRNDRSIRQSGVHGWAYAWQTSTGDREAH